jgi:uncharacterized protein HemY
VDPEIKRLVVILCIVVVVLVLIVWLVRVLGIPDIRVP